MNYAYGRCHICGGKVVSKVGEQPIRVGDDWILVKDIPMGECSRCGERITQAKIAKKIEWLIREKHFKMRKIPVVSYGI